jgi:tight adherence protein B
MPPARFVAICSAVGSGIGLLVAIQSGALWTIAAGTVLGATALPVVALRHMKKARLKRFGIQLPEALDLIVRGLKAGHPVPVALAMVGQEMPDPIGTEFGIVADEMTYGSDLTTALKSLAERVGHEDLPLFVIAVSIQTSTGGNLREILDGLSDTIRGRVKLRRKIRAISTEGRMSAYILTAVPLFLVGAVLLIRPDYYSAVIGESLTNILIGAAVALLAIGNIAMFRMANFRF